ncbi:MAG: Rid family hydrolase [Pseudomonadota bacterium]
MTPSHTRSLKRAAAALVICAAMNAPALAQKEAIVPEGSEWAPEQFQFSPAVRAGEFVFLAGVVANLDRDGNGDLIRPTQDQLIASYENAFRYIGDVLKAADAEFDDVVEMTTFHTDLRAQGDAFIEAKKMFLKEPYPAWTAIDVDRLWPDSGITEIKIVAYAPKKQP